MRLFVGVPIPAAHTFHEVARQISTMVPRARVVPPENHHVTLRFLGEMPSAEPAIAALTPVLAKERAQPGLVEGIGAFPDTRRARVVWARLQAEGLRPIRDRVLVATAKLGQVEPPRAFEPHITLARLDPPEDVDILRNSYERVGFWEGMLREVVLYESVPGAQGPTYKAIRRFALE